MGRLIDADELMEKLVELLQIYVKNPYAQGIIIENIANLPTAYDVDKVVAEIDEARTTNGNFKLALIGVDYVIDKIRKGGV